MGVCYYLVKEGKGNGYDGVVVGDRLCMHKYMNNFVYTDLSSSSPCRAEARGLAFGPSKAEARAVRRSVSMCMSTDM